MVYVSMPKTLTKPQLEWLNKIYYDEHFTFGRDKIWKLGQDKNMGISRRAVMEWLERQETHQLFLRTRRSRVVKPTLLKNEGDQIAIDLIDMSRNAFQQYKWIFTAIDLFTKKGYAVPMKDKTGTTSVNAFKKILEAIGHPIRSVRSDNGSEFISTQFKKLLNDREITQVLSLAGKPQSNGGIERFNRTLKELMKRAKYISSDYDWPKELPRLVKNYNESYHTTTKKTPNQVNQDNKQEVHENIKKAITPKNEDTQKELCPITTQVRVKLREPDEDDGVKWSSEIYRIEKVYKSRKSTSTTSYRLKGLKGVFYRQDLQVVYNTNAQIEKEKLFKVGKIIEPMVLNKKKGYLVHWTGYSKDDDSWVEHDSLIEDIPKMLEDFIKKHKITWSADKKQGFRFKWTK